VVWVLLALVAVAVVAVTLAAASGRLAIDPMSPPVRTTPPTGLPADPVAADLDDVRFDTALRGYRMDQVDEVLGVLRATLDERERELAEARAAAGAEATPSTASVGAPPPPEER
jgi:DivIVA domain-containing protein